MTDGRAYLLHARAYLITRKINCMGWGHQKTSNGHCNSIIELAQWADSMKLACKKRGYSIVFFKCDLTGRDSFWAKKNLKKARPPGICSIFTGNVGETKCRQCWFISPATSSLYQYYLTVIFASNPCQYLYQLSMSITFVSIFTSNLCQYLCHKSLQAIFASTLYP